MEEWVGGNYFAFDGTRQQNNHRIRGLTDEDEDDDDDDGSGG